MQGPSISSAYHKFEAEYTVFLDGRVCLPGGAGDVMVIDDDNDGSRHTTGPVPMPSQFVILSNQTLITFIAC